MADSQSIDVAAMIRRQHQTIRELFAAVPAASPGHRADQFEPLVRLLAVHETAEEMIVYPDVSGMSDRGAEVVDARRAEEDRAKKTLADLESMDPADEAFLAALDSFSRDVEAHASAEEREVLPLLEQHDQKRLTAMGAAFTAAEAMAPTHPHKGAPESAIGNLLVGPFVAMVDRVRDAIRDSGRS